VLARAGLSKLRDLEPVEPVQRYEHGAAGRALANRHQEAGPHRATQPSGHRQPARLGAGVGWKLLLAVDDHACIGFTDLRRDGRAASAVQFLRPTAERLR
jgi:hypothetical protein